MLASGAGVRTRAKPALKIVAGCWRDYRPVKVEAPYESAPTPLGFSDRSVALGSSAIFLLILFLFEKKPVP